ncbi:MAG: TlpA family protein disulfide reductase [Lachnospiraceae bacterium]|nr:TlpA family protein disulfide reductase [Lachnospiraceae bacterium]
MRKKAVIVAMGLLALAMTACGKQTETADAGNAVVSEEAEQQASAAVNEKTGQQVSAAGSEQAEQQASAAGEEGQEPQNAAAKEEPSESAGADLSSRSNADTGEGEPKILAEGDIAPDFSVELVDGGTFRLSDYDDKTVIINFWATWCGPCVGEMPAFEMLKQDENDDLRIICVNCMEDPGTVDQFVKENGYTFPIGYDVNGKVFGYYPTQGIPYTLVVKKGIISKIFVGALDAEYQYTEYKNAIAE